MGYVKENLMPNEQVVCFAKISMYPAIPTAVIGLLSLVMLLAMASAQENRSPGGLFFFIAILVFCALRMLRVVITYLTTEMAVTNSRLIGKTGLISRKTVELRLNSLESAAVDQPIFGRVFNYGSLVFAGSGGTKTPFRFIHEPMKFKRAILIAAEKRNAPNIAPEALTSA